MFVSSGFGRIDAFIGDRMVGHQERHLMRDQPHAVREEIGEGARPSTPSARPRHGKSCRRPACPACTLENAACCTVSTSASRSSSSASGSPQNAHAAEVADIAVIIAAGIDRQHLALLPRLRRGGAVVAGAQRQQAIFEMQAAIGLLAPQLLDDLGLGRALAAPIRMVASMESVISSEAMRSFSSSAAS